MRLGPELGLWLLDVRTRPPVDERDPYSRTRRPDRGSSRNQATEEGDAAMALQVQGRSTDE